ncbi:hypothetical protein A2U01_0106159, partial [Trifolium medium]|nr:hypothetical protein [Trifolium medium]
MGHEELELDHEPPSREQSEYPSRCASCVGVEQGYRR